MSQNRFGVDTAFPPPPPPPVPGYPSPPPRPPAGAGRGRSRWPMIVIAGVVGAVIASIATAILTVQARGPADTVRPTPAPVTVTVAAPMPASPAPLPTAQADRQTCLQGWIPAGNFAAEAVQALQILPPGTKVGDPAIQSNPQWSAAVQNAATSYRSAGDSLDAAIAPGTTPVLAEAAHTAVNALRLLGDAISKGDPVNGNAGEIVDAAGGHVGLLCKRLAS